MPSRTCRTRRRREACSMSSLFRASCLVAVAALTLTACDREERHSRSKPVSEAIPAGDSPDTIIPGGGPGPTLDPRAALYDDNGPAIAAGQELYNKMNC